MSEELNRICSEIDEKYSEYKKTENIASLEKHRKKIRIELIEKILKMVLIHPDFSKLYNAELPNSVFDGFTITQAADDAMKSYPSLYGYFHKYLIKCLNNKKSKDTSEFIDSPLTDSERKKLIKIKRVLKQCENNHKKAASFLQISEAEIDEILEREKIYSLDYSNDADDSKSCILNECYDKKNLSPDSQIDAVEAVNEECLLIETEWIKLKSAAKPVVSDFFTAKILSYENNKIVILLDSPEKVMELLFKFAFINKKMVKDFFYVKDYILPLTLDTLAEKHGITKPTVSKYIARVSDSLENKGLITKKGKKIKKV
ncbi:MAG: hypothetical protein PUK48_03145 [Spirochaetales bacterium]|nr:hypothetical protein [Spirochaetales bacterium]